MRIWPAIVRLALWVLLILSTVTLEISAAAAIITRNVGPYPSSPTARFDVQRGSYLLAIPHESAGRWPTDGWPRLLERSLWGFNFDIASRGRGAQYTRVTMIAFPCWAVAAVSAAITYWLSRRLGLTLIGTRAARGFEPVIVNEPPPAAQTGGSASSAPSK